MSLTFELDAYQTRAFQLCKPGNIVTLPWGRGSGKTFMARACIHMLALSSPVHIGLLMPSLKQARQVFWPHLFADYEGDLRRALRGRPDKTLLTVTYRNGSRLTTWGAENAGSIRGQRFGVVFEDEADDIDPEVEQAVIRPTFSRAGSSAIWWKSGTPRRGRAGSLYFSHNKSLMGAPGYVGFALKSSQSPQVDQTWLKGVQADTPPDIFAREYDVNFDAAGGRVYGDVFVESFHVRLPPSNVVWDDILIGCDHGYEHAGCLLLIGVLGRGRDATAYVLDEVYARHRTPSWWKEQLKVWTGWYPNHKFYADTAQPGTVEEYRRDCGARVQEVNKDVEDGIAAVADRFLIRTRHDEEGNELGRFAKLYVSPHCVNLLCELGCTPKAYEGRKPLDGVGPYMRKRDPKNELRYLDEIVKLNDDACDPLRYTLFNFFGGPDNRRGSSPHEALG